MAVTRLIVVLLTLTWVAVAQSGSARMQLEVQPGFFAQADFSPGAMGKPAVVVLHGFLQTGEFPTVRRRASALVEEGYSVLIPTLSLGINNRRQSLACDAIHTHDLDQDVDELSAWVAWLSRRVGKPPIVVVHSTGGVQIAALLSSSRQHAVRHALLVGLTYFGNPAEPDGAPGLRARALTAPRDEVQGFGLSFCRERATTPEALLSCLDWGAERLRNALVAIPTTFSLIVADNDNGVDSQWLDGLHSQGIAVRRVSGANHLFDLAYELELADEVIAVVESVAHG